MAEVRELKGTRREVAIVLNGVGWITANEIAKALGRPTGAVFGVIRRMHDDGLLRADSDPPTRGTQYRLSDEGVDALNATLALTEDAGIGALAEGMRLLFVTHGTDLRGPTEVLNSEAAAGLLAWGAELPDGWILALVEEADRHRVRTLRVRLQAVGCKCRELSVDTVGSGALLRRRAGLQLGGD